MFKLEAGARYGAWTGAEISEFLHGAVMPMRLGFNSKRGLLVVPLWFCFADSALVACAVRESLVIRSLGADPEVAFDVSTNDLPYRGIRGNGEARCVHEVGSQALQDVLDKYIQDDDHSLARWLSSRSHTEVAIVVEPAWITSWDFSDRMQGLAPLRQRKPAQPI
tara:strand:- start:77 stop:571 length:495 start_codon:yes stop_codon:yes gene_type:complete